MKLVDVFEGKSWIFESPFNLGSLDQPNAIYFSLSARVEVERRVGHTNELKLDTGETSLVVSATSNNLFYGIPVQCLHCR